MISGLYPEMNAVGERIICQLSPANLANIAAFVELASDGLTAPTLTGMRRFACDHGSSESVCRIEGNRVKGNENCAVDPRRWDDLRAEVGFSYRTCRRG